MQRAENASMAEVAPQEYEEIKEGLSFPQRIHHEAVRVQAAHKAEEEKLKDEIQKLQRELQRFKGYQTQTILPSQDYQPLIDKDRERVQTIQAMISERENKIRINTKALNDCQQQVLNILQQTHCSFSKLQICSPQKQGRLVLRETDRLNSDDTYATEFEFPPRDKIRYDNPVVGFKTGKWPCYDCYGWNLIM
jgi:DNA repair exonuclease SbcCD ATPase subunit